MTKPTYIQPPCLEVRIMEGPDGKPSEWRRTSQDLCSRLHQNYQGKSGKRWLHEILATPSGEVAETHVDGVARQWRLVPESEAPRESRHWMRYADRKKAEARKAKR